MLNFYINFLSSGSFFSYFKFCVFILVSTILLQVTVLAEEPSSSNIMEIINDKLSKWTSIQYSMDIDLGGKDFGYKVHYRSPSNLKTVSWNKNDNSDKITMIVFKNTTTIFDHKKKDKQTHDTGNFDMFRINNEYDKNWKLEYLGEFKLAYDKDGKEEKRACWVIQFTTQQGVQYRFWIDQYIGIALRMEVRLRQGEKPFVIAKTTSFKLDVPLEDSVFQDPF